MKVLSELQYKSKFVDDFSFSNRYLYMYISLFYTTLSKKIFICFIIIPRTLLYKISKMLEKFLHIQ